MTEMQEYWCIVANIKKSIPYGTDGEYEKEHKILESKVDKSIAIKDINALDGELKVCVSVGEYTGGHPIEASLSEKYKVTSLDH